MARPTTTAATPAMFRARRAVLRVPLYIISARARINPQRASLLVNERISSPALLDRLFRALDEVEAEAAGPTR